MRTHYSLLGKLAAMLLVAVVGLTIPSPRRAFAAPQDGADGSDASSKLRKSKVPGSFVLRVVDGKYECAPATPEEAAELENEPQEALHDILPARERKADDGLIINLKATQQLEGFPAAKAAFIRAAEEWEAVISAPITIIINVDFGPKRFGQNYPPGVLGSTGSQLVGASNNYDDVRTALIAKSSPGAEANLNASLPPTSVPTDIGPTTEVDAPSANFRALGLLNPVANPDTELGLGSPPAIGFNSNFKFDFNPDDGIDADAFDFDATAVHELGHVLGFTSIVGYHELDSSIPAIVSVWDIYRFHPGVNSGSFGTAQRVLSSGGVQDEFIGGADVPLSTGRPDASGGDHFQASHWKERNLNGSYVGIMDPAGDFGDRDVMTDNDVAALDFMGYARAGAGGPTINTLTASLDGDTLTINGTAGTSPIAITMASGAYLDGAGNSLQTIPAFAVTLDGSRNFTIMLTGLNALPSALQISLALQDANGATGQPRIANFATGDAGGPSITKANFNKTAKKLKLTGGNFGTNITVLVNGVVVAPPAGVKTGKGGTVLKVSGTSTALGLHSGANRIQVKNGTLRSNLIVFNF